jgi:tetratricopeptide (TPR) repeat protein
MSSDEHSAEAWLARGTEVYLKQRFAEAVEYFKKAVAIDSGSVEAHLALGATYLTFYKRRPSPPSPDYIRAGRDILEAEWRAYRKQEQEFLAQQNATNWPLAEESLKRANRLDPRHKLVMEYLCALYFAWKDPLDEENNRMEEAKQWFERLADIYPDHKYANFYCGLIASMGARKLLPNYGRFPRPPETQEDRRSLRAKAGPLLEYGRRHLSRTLTLDPAHTGAFHFMAEIRSMEAYLADTAEESRHMRIESGEWKSKQRLVSEAATQGGPVAAGPSATITFRASPEALAEARARPFPPNPWWI